MLQVARPPFWQQTKGKKLLLTLSELVPAPVPEPVLTGQKTFYAVFLILGCKKTLPENFSSFAFQTPSQEVKEHTGIEAVLCRFAAVADSPEGGGVWRRS